VTGLFRPVDEPIVICFAKLSECAWRCGTLSPKVSVCATGATTFPSILLLIVNSCNIEPRRNHRPSTRWLLSGSCGPCRILAENDPQITPITRISTWLVGSCSDHPAPRNLPRNFTASPGKTFRTANVLPIGDDVCFIDLLCPIARLDIFNCYRDRFFSTVQSGGNVLHICSASRLFCWSDLPG
jgi:hypothetical protein